MTTIALFGAGGKMGCRITDNLKDSDYRMVYIEISPAGIENLRQRGLSPTPQDEALAVADVAILALPDNLIERISAQIIPQLKAGALVMCLDPAAPLAGKVKHRDDLAYFVTHPCHPSVFSYDVTPEQRRDFFGGIKAPQAIVNALMHGTDANYERGEAIAKLMYGPVTHSHRVTVEQMAILEPALSETTGITCIKIIREAMDEAIRRGVPHDAARDFILGHINIELAILFDEIPVQFSDGAKKAMERARAQIIQPDWKNIFEPENIRACLEEITRAPESKS
ncbi:MAG TPA: phosphogluconate dehydrogenase C-terminal domain-containing protein [Blastocatellia bacterium]|nr:phosphogluconate dehydrogenase C-terminal domain-containing protein [Blastocatellia bacterium]